MKNFNSVTLSSVLVLAACTSGTASGAVVHRYSFNETTGATTVTDSAGGAHGTIRQIDADTNGVPDGNPVFFDGIQANLDGSGGYIDLPNGLVSSLNELTIEAWVTTFEVREQQRIFDFGAITNNTGGPGGLEDTSGTLRGGTFWGTQYLFLTPNTPPSSDPRARFAASVAHWPGERLAVADTVSPWLTGVEMHVAVVYSSNSARLFVNGLQTGATYIDPTNAIPLSQIQDVNVWLGRSTYGADPMFAGAFNEFRIHDRRLTSQELLASYFNFNPDVMNYDPGAVQAVSLTVLNSMLVGDLQTPQITGTFANIGQVALTFDDLTLTSSAPSVVAVDLAGRLVALAPGNATITARLDGQEASQTINVSVGAPQLRHRYSFSEAPGSLIVVDSVGGADGSVVPGPTGTNITFVDGQADFPGADSFANAAYIDLPDGMLSTKTNVTIEFWFTWDGPDSDPQGTWQRVFDFGNSSKGNNPNVPGSGTDHGYIMFTPRRGGSGERVEFNPSQAGSSVFLDAPAGFPVGEEVHVAIVYSPSSQFARYYLNGLPIVTSTTTLFPLNQLIDPNCWLGVSQWDDPALNGRINEFRIYEGRLSELEVALSRQAGPDLLAPAPGDLLSVRLEAPFLLVGNPVPGQAALLADFQNVTNVDITGVSGVQLRGLDTNLFTVSPIGGLTPGTNAGTTNLIASFQGLSTTTAVTVLRPVSLSLALPNQLFAGGFPSNATLLATFPGSETNGLADIDVGAFSGVVRSSSNPEVATITPAGVVTPLSVGTTVLTSIYGGVTNQVTLNVVQPPGAVTPALAHRYSFEGTGATAEDLIGDIDGTIMNATLTGTGSLNLANTGLPSNDPAVQWVDFGQSLVPPGALSITLETWFTPAAYTTAGGNQGNWIFNLNDAVEGSATTGQYLFYTPWGAGGSANRQAFRWSKGGFNNEVGGDIGGNGEGLNDNQLHHAAVVVDGVNMTFSLYVDGVMRSRVGFDSTWNLATLTAAWLARSSYGPDAAFSGAIHEFRVHQGALLQSDINASIAAGPDTLPTPRVPLMIDLVGSTIQLRWSTNVTSDAVLQRTAALGSSADWSNEGIPMPTIVGNEYQVTVPLTDTTAFFRLGQE